jgi:hypothetical protein
MTLEEFRTTLTDAHPPIVSTLLQAMWHDARDRWDQAHTIAQDVAGAEAAWVHAYLHRKEGDLGNAAYWYRQACRPVATDALDEEWTRIVTDLLKDSSG